MPSPSLWPIDGSFEKKGLVKHKLSVIKAGDYFWFRGNKYLKLKGKPNAHVKGTFLNRVYFYRYWCVRLDTAEIVELLGNHSVTVIRN